METYHTSQSVGKSSDERTQLITNKGLKEFSFRFMYDTVIEHRRAAITLVGTPAHQREYIRITATFVKAMNAYLLLFSLSGPTELVVRAALGPNSSYIYSFTH